jgi:hypothetical protein
MSVPLREVCKPSICAAIGSGRSLMLCTYNGERFKLCRGDLIALSDQRGLWHQEKLAQMAPLFEQQPDGDGAFRRSVIAAG